MTDDAPQDQNLKCDFQVTKELKCSLDPVSPQKTKCVFHQYHGWNDFPAQEVVSEYIRQSLTVRPRGPIYLSGMTFQGIKFDNEMIAHGVECISANALFKNCRFEHLVVKDVDFSGCLFSASQFLDCIFSGKHARFGNCRFESAEVPFAECQFSLSESNHEFDGTVEFRSVLVNRADQLFSRCILRARSISLVEARLDVNQLRVLLSDGSGSFGWSGLV